MQSPNVGQWQAASMWVERCHALLPSDRKFYQGNQRGTQRPREKEAFEKQTEVSGSNLWIQLTVSHTLVYTCLSGSSSGPEAEGGALAAAAICIWQFLAVFSKTSARMMARRLSLASSSAILILSYGHMQKILIILGSVHVWHFYILSRKIFQVINISEILQVLRSCKILKPWKEKVTKSTHTHTMHTAVFYLLYLFLPSLHHRCLACEERFESVNFSLSAFKLVADLG